MLSSFRYTVLLVLLSALAGSAWAQGWVNHLLVHRTPSYTLGGADSCLTCHSGEKMRAVANSAHGDADNPLAPFAQHQCESCHGEGSIHVSRAHGGKGYPPLTVFGHQHGAAARDRQVDACLRCHADEDSGIKVTPFQGTLHDKWIVHCSSCHKAHSEKDPVLNRGSQADVCLGCHSRQREEHKKVGQRVPDFSRMGCAGCHRVHRLPKPEKSED